MAAGSAFFGQELATKPVAAAEGSVGRYLGSSSHGAAAHFQSAGGAHPAGAVVPAVGSLGIGIGIGMAPPRFFTADGMSLSPSAGYRAAGACSSVGIAAAPQPRTGPHGEATAPFKGAWTDEEDDILKELVRVLGDRKWAAISKSLPGRIGKQCRERWINHLRPDIKKDVWTEADDRALIEAHRACGNRWSVIARCLPGRSENAVKNHWNATKRSLKSKRRSKKKKSEQAPPGHFTLLEDYIRSLCPPNAQDPAAPPPVSATATAPPSDNHVSGGLADPNAAAAAVLHPGMYLLNPANSAGLSHMGTANLNMPPPPDMIHCYYGEPWSHLIPSFAHLSQLPYGAPVPAPVQPAAQMIIAHDLQAAYTSLNLGFECQHSNQGVSAGGYYGEAGPSNAAGGGSGGGYYGEAGPSNGSGGGGGDQDDIVQMASREFLARPEDEVTLDLTRFM